MERYKRSLSEADMLKAIADYVAAENGIFWHIRNARGQNLVGAPDVICVLPPRAHRAPGLVAFLELKTDQDVLTESQRHALFLLERATEIVSGVVRPVPHNTLIEITLDEVLELLGKQP